MGERIGTIIGLAFVVVILVASVAYCSKVNNDCRKERGVVVKNYYNQPECIEKGQH